MHQLIYSVGWDLGKGERHAIRSTKQLSCGLKPPHIHANHQG
jgi:hypothetical protein